MNWQEFFFNGWSQLARTLTVGVLAYTALIVLLRVAGKRTLSKFNAFDFVVTVALGSTLATILLSKDVALVQGILAFIVLMGLQFAITWLSVRSSRVRGLVKSEPALLLHRGEFLDAALRRERVTREEVLAAARSQQVASLKDVEAAVIETDGSITIVPSRAEASPSAFSSVHGHPDGTGDPDAR